MINIFLLIAFSPEHIEEISLGFVRRDGGYEGQVRYLRGRPPDLEDNDERHEHDGEGDLAGVLTARTHAEDEGEASDHAQGTCERKNKDTSSTFVRNIFIEWLDLYRELEKKINNHNP